MRFATVFSTHCALALIAVLPGSPPAADPLYAKNLSPVAGLLGFPVMREAHTLAAGEIRSGITGSIANNYTSDQSSNKSVNFDVETRRVAWVGKLGLGAGFDIEAEVPWLRHEGGDLDALIEDWHSLFGLPDGNRDDVPRDLVDVHYAGPDAAFGLAETASGLGDVSLALAREVWSGEQAAISARLGAKFGTGDEDQLLGSGSNDYYVALNASGDHRGDAAIRWHGQLGYLHAGDFDPLGESQEHDLWFAALSMDWRVMQALHLLLQVDSHAGVADSALTQLGDSSVQLTVGGRWDFARKWAAEFSFSEDIAVNTAPDFVVQLGIWYRPN